MEKHAKDEINTHDVASPERRLRLGRPRREKIAELLNEIRSLTLRASNEAGE